MAFAAAICARPGPDDEIGKNNSGSANRQAAVRRQSAISINMAISPFLALESGPPPPCCASVI